MDWNPNSPELRGLELAPRKVDELPSYRIASPSAAVAQRFDVTSSFTINGAAVLVNPETPRCRMLVEFLIAGSEIPTDVQTTKVPVSGVTNGTGLDNSPAAVGMTEEDVLNQDPLDETKYLFNGPTDPDADMYLSFDTTGVFTGRRILAWRLVVVASRGVEEFSFALEPQQWEPSTSTAWNVFVTPDPPISAPPASPETRVYDFGEAIQRTLSLITVATLVEFDVGGDWQIHLSMPDGTVDEDTLRVHQAWLEVDHCVENRKGRAIFEANEAGLQWLVSPQIERPDGTAFMPVTSGQDLTVLLRQIRWGGLPYSEAAILRDRFSVPYIEALPGSTMPTGVVHYPTPGITARGDMVDLGDPADRLLAIDLGAPEVDSSSSVDSQPYASATETFDFFGFATIQQEITTAGAETYHGVIVFVRDSIAAGADAGDELPTMVVNVRRRSDNVLMGAATMTGHRYLDAPIDSDGEGWRRVQIPFPAGVAFAAATQYYAEFTDMALDITDPFYVVPVLFTTTPELTSSGLAPGTATAGGTTDQATVNLDFSTADIPVMLYQQPDPVDSFTVEADRLDFDSGTDDCGITGIPFVKLLWEASPDAGTFAHYEIQSLRNPAWVELVDILNFTFSEDWQTIARITDINAEGTGGGDGMIDFYAPIGLPTFYRVRVVTTYGVASPWSDVLMPFGVPPFAQPDANGECGYWFASNAYPEAACGYSDAHSNPAERLFTFPEADEVQIKAFHGRDGFVAFIPAERRGVEFSRRLLLSAFNGLRSNAPSGADTLRNLSRVPGLGSICVRDEHGGIWFANVRVHDYADLRPAEGDQIEHVNITVSELTTIPPIIDAVY